MEILYHEQVAKRDFPRLPKSVRRRIFAAVENKIMTAPFDFGKPLRSPLGNFRSLRVGDYRIVYAIEKSRVIILAVGHRKNIYEIALGRR